MMWNVTDCWFHCRAAASRMTAEAPSAQECRAAGWQRKNKRRICWCRQKDVYPGSGSVPSPAFSFLVPSCGEEEGDWSEPGRVLWGHRPTLQQRLPSEMNHGEHGPGRLEGTWQSGGDRRVWNWNLCLGILSWPARTMSGFSEGSVYLLSI